MINVLPNRTVDLHFSAPHGTKFTIEFKLLGAASFTVLADNWAAATFQHQVGAAGTYVFVVTPKNSTGSAPASAPVAGGGAVKTLFRARWENKTTRGAGVQSVPREVPVLGRTGFCFAPWFHLRISNSGRRVGVESLWRYHGIDWLGIIFSMLSTYYLGKKRKRGFLLGIVGNIAFVAFGVMAESAANVVANGSYLILNSRGWWKWHKKPPTEKE